MKYYRRNGLAVLGALAITMALAIAGCSSDAPDDDASLTPTASPSMTMDTGDGSDQEHDFSFGHPADATEATRTIEIEALDALKFSPAAISVAAGETVTFRVHNGGSLPHEFGLGTADDQADHEEEMQDMAGMTMHDEPNAFSLEPGETKELTWTFKDAVEVLYGCHEPGHYGAGMVGTITVE